MADAELVGLSPRSMARLTIETARTPIRTKTSSNPRLWDVKHARNQDAEPDATAALVLCSVSRLRE